MAERLLNRQMQIPHGLKFYIPGIPTWQSPKGSFQLIVDSALRALQANPGVANQMGWPLDENFIADRVDEYNARICEANGWTDYITNSSAPSLPKASPRDQQTLLRSLRNAAEEAKELVRGAKTLIEWKASGEIPVTIEEAEARAKVCAACPLNDPQDWTAWFTKPAAELIRRQVEEVHAMELKTSLDEKLHCCTACHCPLQVKIWPRIEWIAKGLTPQKIEKLRAAPACWILQETGK